MCPCGNAARHVNYFMGLDYGTCIGICDSSQHEGSYVEGLLSISIIISSCQSKDPSQIHLNSVPVTTHCRCSFAGASVPEDVFASELSPGSLRSTAPSEGHPLTLSSSPSIGGHRDPPSFDLAQLRVRDLNL